jgi:hypothetical protein
MQVSAARPVFDPKILFLLLQRGCKPGRCSHCCTDSRPDSAERLTLPQIDQALDQGRKAGLTLLNLSGGDPLFRFGEADDPFRYAVEEGQKRGYQVTDITTNASWAISPGKAEETLREIRSFLHMPECHSLKKGCFSTSLDQMHQANIGLKKVFYFTVAHLNVFPDTGFIIRTVLEPSSELQTAYLNILTRSNILNEEDIEWAPNQASTNGLKLARKAVFTHQELHLKRHLDPEMTAALLFFLESENVLEKFYFDEKIGRQVIRIKGAQAVFQYSALSRVGRAAELPQNAYLPLPITRQRLSQMTWNEEAFCSDALAVDWNGRIFPSVRSITLERMSPGTIGDITIAEALARLNKDPIVRALELWGPGSIFYSASQLDRDWEKRLLGSNSLDDLVMTILKQTDPDKLRAELERMPHIPKPGDFDLKSKEAAREVQRMVEYSSIDHLLKIDWQGREKEFLDAAARLFQSMPADLALNKLIDNDFQGIEPQLFKLVVNGINENTILQNFRTKIAGNSGFIGRVLEKDWGYEILPPENLERFVHFVSNALQDQIEESKAVINELADFDPILLSKALALLADLGLIDVTALLINEIQDVLIFATILFSLESRERSAIIAIFAREYSAELINRLRSLKGKVNEDTLAALAQTAGLDPDPII